MRDLFETVLILSAIGFALTAVLLCLKPITVKKFSAKWQYYIWIAVLLTMVIPTYKLIPKQQVQQIRRIAPIEAPRIFTVPYEPSRELLAPLEPTPTAEPTVTVSYAAKTDVLDVLSIIWIAGGIVFLTVVLLSYLLYLWQKRKQAVALEDTPLLIDVKKELGIRRHIRVRMSPTVGSPMLVGVFFPVIYIPCRELPKDMMRLVLLHELTHYKRKDLIVKWFSLLVNAVHWFNPLSYLVCANLSDACELSCDGKVTRNMNEEEQKQYMKTILALVE